MSCYYVNDKLIDEYTEEEMELQRWCSDEMSYLGLVAMHGCFSGNSQTFVFLNQNSYKKYLINQNNKKIMCIAEKTARG